MDLDQLDAERGGPFTVLVDGEPRVVPPASALGWKSVVAAATSPHWFSLLAWPADVRLKGWQIEAAQHAWCVHNGLPEPAQVRRLVKMIEDYGVGIQYDLRDKLGVSLGQMWRDRQWRELLDYIDLLPTNSHKNRLMANDEAYMEAVMGAKGGETSNRPSMADWSPEVSGLARLIDAVNRNTMVTQAVAGVKGSKLSLPPEPRPQTAADKVSYRKSQQEHESMNAMLLRDR